MANDGLSIFDEDPAEADHEPTQVIQSPPSAAHPRAEATASPAGPDTTTPSPTVAQPPEATASIPKPTQATPVVVAPSMTEPLPTAPKAPFLPQVRRGYDPAAVDAHLRTMAADRAGLIAALEEAQNRINELAEDRESIRKQLEEQEAPTYTGLGDRASELLRMAEEQAAAVISQARAEASQIKETASREATKLRAQAQSEVEGQRLTALREL